VALEQVAELQVFAEHVEALVPAESLEIGRMRAALRAGGEGAAFETVPAEIPAAKSGLRGTCLDDRGGGPGGDRLTADSGQGRGRARPAGLPPMSGRPNRGATRVGLPRAARAVPPDRGDV